LNGVSELVTLRAAMKPPSRPLLYALAALAILAGATRAAEPVRPSVRVVSQAAGTDDLLLALADAGQIAALSHLARDPAYSMVAEEARHHPQLAQGDAETILKFAPTLVLGADFSRVELLEQVRRAGVRVLVFDRYRTLDEAFANLRRLGQELGPVAAARAERVIAESRARVAALAQRLRGITPVRVIAPSNYGVIGGLGTTFQDLCDHAGAINLAATLGGLTGHVPPPGEQLLTWPVDRVVVTGSDLAAALAPFRAIPPYQLLPAVREGRAVLLEERLLSCVSHRRIEGYERLARALHPEVFK
jgi:iron complex transport system substrate-binding protein